MFGTGRNALFGVVAASVLLSGPSLAQSPSARASSVAGAGAASSSGKVTFASPEAAYNHGISALHSGHPELAIASLEFAADHDHTLARFYLASRIYADNALAYTNHARAYELYEAIANDHASIEDDDPLVPLVAKAFTALASYLRSGIASEGQQSGLRPNPRRATEYLRHAATALSDEDAQYELAKVLLNGEGVKESPRDALLWLSVLSEKGHTGAQALLADLYWRGKHVRRDQKQALALITLAVENAPASERVWIEDTYQRIFCGAGEGVRRQAQGEVANWRTKFGRVKEERDTRDGLAPIQSLAERTCSNGEMVPPGLAPPSRRSEVRAQSNPAMAPMPNGAASGPTIMQGNTGGFGLRDAGQTSSPLR